MLEHAQHCCVALLQVLKALSRTILSCMDGVTRRLNFKMAREKLLAGGHAVVVRDADFAAVVDFLINVGPDSQYWKELQQFHSKMINAQTRRISMKQIACLADLPNDFPRSRVAIFKLAYNEKDPKKMPHCDVIKAVFTTWLSKTAQRPLLKKTETYLTRFHDEYQRLDAYALMTDKQRICLLGNSDIKLVSPLLAKAELKPMLEALDMAAGEIDASIRARIAKDVHQGPHDQRPKAAAALSRLPTPLTQRVLANASHGVAKLAPVVISFDKATGAAENRQEANEAEASAFHPSA